MRPLGTRLRREQGGWAIVTTLVLMAAILGAGLAVVAYTDQQQQQSATERIRESALNLAEGVLNTQSFLVARNWPSTSSNGAYVAPCTSANSAGRAVCPDPTALAGTFTGPDYGESSWSATVRDNPPPYDDFYAESVQTGAPPWDAFADREMWVRASATVRGQTRTLVARVRVSEHTELLPSATITAGKVGTHTQGNKVIIDTQDDLHGNARGPVQVRCNLLAVGCVVSNLLKGHIEPDLPVHFGGGDILDEGALARLRSTAKQLGTWYATCPANAPSGPLVFIEDATAVCTYTGGTCCNSQTNPGALVIAKGTIRIGGTNTFYGAIYNANTTDSTGYLVETFGNGEIRGTVAVDGPGGVYAGADKTNITYDATAVAGLLSFNPDGIALDTWREVQP